MEKMGLFMVCAGNIPLWDYCQDSFMIYYTTVVGLEPAALADPVFNIQGGGGISDPIRVFAGQISSHKNGKFRPRLSGNTSVL